MIQQLFQSRISTFFGVNVIVSVLVLIYFIFAEGSHLKMGRLWIYVMSTLLVGVSLDLPLFLYIRESKLE